MKGIWAVMFLVGTALISTPSPALGQTETEEEVPDLVTPLGTTEQTRLEGIDARDEAATLTGEKLRVDKERVRGRVLKRLSKIEDKLQKLDRRAEIVVGEARDSLDEQREDIRQLEQEVRTKLNRLQESVGTDYMILRSSLERQVRKLSREVDRALF